ncbi:MAG: hypothetical protein RTU30_13800 [Candidatus Thorarchaeota archaeon]
MVLQPVGDGNVSRYMRGFKEFSKIVNSKISDDWNRLGIFTFYDSPYSDNDELYLCQKQAIISFAEQAKKRNQAVVLLIDALEGGPLGLDSPQGFRQFIQLFDSIFPNSVKLYFGPRNSDRKWLHDLDTMRIPLSWLIKRPNIFADNLSDASPIGEDIGPGDAGFDDLATMIEVLTEKLGPPSLTEEVLGRIRGAETDEYAGEAAGMLASLINPATAVSRGVKYISKFVTLLKERRREEVKEVYEEWRARVVAAYSEDNLKKFFDDDPESQSILVKAVEESIPVLVILETRDTLYDLFLPLVYRHLVEEIGYIPPHKRRRKKPKPGEEPESSDWIDQSAPDEDIVSDSDLPPVTDQIIQDLLDEGEQEPSPYKTSIEFEGKPRTSIFIDAATHLSKFRRSFRFALGIPDTYPNISLAASFFTNKENLSKTLAEGVIEYASERAVLFDLHPNLFDLITSRTPVSEKAWLQGQLKEIERNRRDGNLSFLDFMIGRTSPWMCHTIGETKMGFISGLIQRLRGASQ